MRPEDAAQPRAQLLHSRSQELRPQIELPAVGRPGTDPRGLHDHRRPPVARPVCQREAAYLNLERDGTDPTTI